MPTFPTLSSGSMFVLSDLANQAIAMYPSTLSNNFLTRTTQFVDDTEQRFPVRQPLFSAILQYHDCNGYDLSAVRDFFNSQLGAYVSNSLDSTFSITIAGQTYQYCAFDQDIFEVQEDRIGRYTFTVKVVQVRPNDGNPAVGPSGIYTFPQINSNMIMTQYPYVTDSVFETVRSDIESGMRWTYPRRGNQQLATNFGYSAGPLGKYTLNFPSITDAEVNTLSNFFYQMGGMWGEFRFLDPGGNLLMYSEDFTKPDWDRSTGVNVVGPCPDPFGKNRGMQLQFSAGSTLLAYIAGGSATSGNIFLNGYRMCASVWVYSAITTPLGIGFRDHPTTGSFQQQSKFFQIPANSWTRLYFSCTLWTNTAISVLLTSLFNVSVNVFGFQVVPMKGEGAYVRTPGSFGFHPHCRFNADAFTRQVIGPNQNQVVLPIAEING